MWQAGHKVLAAVAEKRSKVAEYDRADQGPRSEKEGNADLQLATADTIYQWQIHR